MKLLHTAKFDLADGLYQARNQGGAGEAKPPRKYFALMEKSVGHNVKYIGHSSKILGPSRKTFRPSWCRKLVMGLDFTQMFPIHVNGFNFTKNCIKLFSLVPISLKLLDHTQMLLIFPNVSNFTQNLNGVF